MTIEEIERFIGQAERSATSTFEREMPGARLVLRKMATGTRPHAAARAPKTQAGRRPIRADATGVFLASHPLAAQEARRAGERVAGGEIVGFLRVGPCLRPVIAQSEGAIERCLVEDGVLAGYGTPLYDLSKG